MKERGLETNQVGLSQVAEQNSTMTEIQVIPLSGLPSDLSGENIEEVPSLGDLTPQKPSIKPSMAGGWEEVRDVFEMVGKKRPKQPSQKDINKLNEWKRRTYGLNLDYMHETEVYIPPKNPQQPPPEKPKSK